VDIISLLVAGCWWLVAVESTQVEVAMSHLRFLLPCFFVLTAFGETPQNAVDPTRISKEAVQAILGASLGQSKPGAAYEHLIVGNVPMETACSVPLVEMKIPTGVDFAIAQVPPPSDFHDNMPVAKGLPACPTVR
jgi:hypothetical protein